MKKRSLYFIHPTAEVTPDSKIGKGTKIWHHSQIREGVRIGKNCIIGKNVYLDYGVVIGDNCKIQNNCSLYHGTTLENGVFVGPHVVFANDNNPRAINPDGSLKDADDWKVGKIIIKRGASIGANCVILPGITVGSFAMVGAGSVVTKNVTDLALVYGNPAKLYGTVNQAGKITKLSK